jgi:hypothetical protein
MSVLKEEPSGALQLLQPVRPTVKARTVIPEIILTNGLTLVFITIFPFVLRLPVRF